MDKNIIHDIVKNHLADLGKPMQRLKQEFMATVRGYLRPTSEDERLFSEAEDAARLAVEDVLIENNPFHIPNLDVMYNAVCKFVYEHQGEKGYIDTQDKNADTIYTFVYEDFSGQGEERIVYGVRVEIDEHGTKDLQICFEPFTRTYRVVYDDNCFRGLNEDPEANAVWYSVKCSDVYYIPTIFNIAEAIGEYVVEDDETTCLDDKEWDELSEHDKGIVSDLEM